MQKSTKGFTVIELLVVVAIIGLLASIVLASLSAQRDRARYTRVEQELGQVAKAITVAREETGGTLLEVTGSGCSDCAGCRGGVVLHNVPAGHACYQGWLAALTDITNATKGVYDVMAFTRDPWGSPYTLDENQGEGGNCTQADDLRSAGPNGVRGTGDDYGYPVPLFHICP